MANAPLNPRRFLLWRDEDVTGVSGTGCVAEGIKFSDGTVALRWRSQWPTSVVFHDRGIDAVEAVHGHGGATEIDFIDPESANCKDDAEQEHQERREAIASALEDLGLGDAPYQAADVLERLLLQAGFGVYRRSAIA